jgi:4-alpha-glucanotransferase
LALCLLFAELGVITPDVEDLRDHFPISGNESAAICLFTNEKQRKSPSQLHNYNCICYTGTHDTILLLAGTMNWIMSPNKEFCVIYQEETKIPYGNLFD